jgi:hypothetical protein
LDLRRRLGARPCFKVGCTSAPGRKRAVRFVGNERTSVLYFTTESM